jgi:hypothetical protein
MKIKNYRKRKLGTFITLLFVISFVISPILMFGKYSQAVDIQEDDIFPEEGELIYLNVPYTYAGTFYDADNLMFAFSTAQIDFRYDPTTANPLWYDFPITSDFTKLETHQPYDETNFTATEGSYSNLNNTALNDDNYGSWNYTGIGEYRATYSFTDELDGTSGTDIGFVDTATFYDGSCEIVSEWQSHKKVLRFLGDATPAEDPYFEHITEQATSGEVEFWIGSNEVNTVHWTISFQDTGVGYIQRLRIEGTDLDYYDGAWQKI